MKNVFEAAAINKYRFQVKQAGILSAEDLYDMPLQSDTGGPDLDKLALSIAKAIKDQDNQVSFVTKKKPMEVVELEDKLEIVKSVIEYKLSVMRKREETDEKAVEKNRLIEALSRKKQDSLDNMSEEELQERLRELA